MTYKPELKDERDREIQDLTESLRRAKDTSVKKEISDFSGMRPEVVAQLIRSWMNSDK